MGWGGWRVVERKFKVWVAADPDEACPAVLCLELRQDPFDRIEHVA